jgi:glycosyltransferase involved in cell wall biosynthesis
MNILVLNYEFPPLGGGAGSVSFEISKRYVQLGHSVDVVTMGYKDLPEKETKSGINVYRVKCIRLKKEICGTNEMISYVLSSIIFLNRLMKQKKYDICHCHFIIPTGVIAWWLNYKYKLDFIITVHGSDVPGYNPDRFKFEHKFTKQLLKGISKRAKVVCSPSLYLKKMIKENISEFYVNHIPNGIDLDNFKLDLSMPKKNIILSTGRLLKRKGFHTLINAVHGVKLPYEVHIAGDGPYRKNLEKIALGSKTKIVFHGWIDKDSNKLLKLYEEASIFVLMSSKENASIALLEGMAAKCAVITTNVSGCPETIGDAGYLIDYEDDKKLREILILLSESRVLVENFSEMAYKRLVKNYLWEQIIDDYIKVLTH